MFKMTQLVVMGAVVSTFFFVSSTSYGSGSKSILAPAQVGESSFGGLKAPKAPDFTKLNQQPAKKTTRKQGVKRKKALKIKPTKLRFDDVKIKGVVSQPRLKFELDELPIEPMDEELPTDFVDKILEETKANKL